MQFLLKRTVPVKEIYIYIYSVFSNLYFKINRRQSEVYYKIVCTSYITKLYRNYLHRTKTYALSRKTAIEIYIMQLSIGYCRCLLTRDYHTIPSALAEPVHTVSLKNSKRCIQPIERDLNIKIYTQTLTISKEILTFLHTCRSLYIHNHQDNTPLILHRDGFQTYSNDVPLYKKQTLFASHFL